ncbi:ATP-binding protein [Mucilaginibacter polytrichastri]|uniref:histidine kinase n=1 Tax=Mucilaginibacter polytrichastri TaxID=1302689 RepID=A0A1Q5ZWU8_9SPHI|nr:ATP-binding protein [Mucilaginibacter polytrichastri]OKS86241.1 hypothetical protein RG47T_1693 [Mucilaginibacter polytrichastri]SFT16233.1 PAS domain S-box-containing protein [Mucilaginibacter polytrichastri]
MQHFNDPLFRIIFDQLAEPRLILKPYNADFIIVAANAAYLAATGYELADLSGKSIWNFFKVDAAGHHTVKIFQTGLNDVLEYKSALKLPIFRFDTLHAPRWWQVEILPVMDEVGQIAYLTCTTYNVTIQVEDEATIKSGKAAMLVQQQTEITTAEQVAFRTQELTDSEYRLSRIVSATPCGLCILKGENFIIDIINGPLLTLWGRTEKDILNQPLLKVFPELEGQPFQTFLIRVRETSHTVTMKEQSVVIIGVDGKPKYIYADFSYDPLFDVDLNVEAVLVTYSEVTSFVHARNLLEDREQVLEAMNEEMNAANEELQAMNEEMTVTNEEMESSNEELLAAREEQQVLYEQLQASEQNLRLAAEAAHIGYWHIQPESKALQYDDMLAQIFGYEDQEPMTYEMAIGQVTPEFNGLIQDAINEAITKGDFYDITYTQRRFNDNELIWLHSFGRVIADQDGQYTLFSGVVMDVTKEINSRLEIADLNERLNMAIASAEMGTWYIQADSRESVFSERLRAIFGFETDEEMTLEAAIAQIDSVYREKVAIAVEAALTDGVPFSQEYPIIRQNDNSRRWVKATGKLFPAQDGVKSYFSGTAVDITERKADEQRKNDFIGIVSHELKTPLTTLKGYLQVMQMTAKKPGENSVYQNSTERALLQINKMQRLIGGFLDVARLNAGRIELNKSNFDMDHLIRNAVADNQQLHKGQPIVYKSGGFQEVFADEDKIEQVLNNLLSNAGKYAPAQSTITVFCNHDKSTITVTVQDQGPGISQDDLPRLFDRFFRVENAQTNHIPGFGIGLYLCSEIILQHGGRIWAKSQPGQGAEFSFSLPLK